MPNWKKVIISGSNISQLTNDSGYVLADQVSGSSTLPISNLSASLTITDQTISSSVAALSASASTRRDVMYSQLEFMSVSLSGSNSTARNVLADQVSGSSTLPISNLSASLTSTDQTISSSIAALSGSASDARNLLGGGSSTALSASLTTTDQIISSSVATLSGSASTSRNLLISNISGSSTLPISNLSASLTTTDQIISSSVAILSGSASDARNLLGGASSPWYDGGTFLSSSVDVRITGSLSMVGSEANFETLQVVLPQISQSGNFADDTAAAIGGIVLGGLYRNGNLIAIRLS